MPDYKQRTQYSLSPSGFTLIEVLLTTAISVIILTIGIPVYLGFQTRSNLENDAYTIAESLMQARIMSQGVQYDSSWGVYVTSGTLTLFRGSSFASRVSSSDEVIDLTSTATPSGLTEIVFSKFTGDPQAVGTITLTSNNNEIKTLTINAKGLVTY